jgi:hypothetical protein
MTPPPNYRAIAAAAARKYGVPVDVFLAQIQQESGFRPVATSSAGAQGIAQFMPATARQYGVNTADPVSSLQGAAHMDSDLIHRYGSVARALSAYNSGRPDAYKDPGFAGGQTYNYVKGILAAAGAGGNAPAAPAVGAPATRGAAPVQSPVAAALGMQAAPPPDPRAQLLRALAATQGPDLTGFYRQLGRARQAQAAQAAAPQPLAYTGQSPNIRTLPYTGQSPNIQNLPYTGQNGGFVELLHEGVGGPTHSTGEHIHFASTNPQTELQAIKLAEQLGLSVRENPYTGDTVDPVHATNSYHYRTFPGLYNGRRLGEAADASGDRNAMLRLYALLSKRQGRA